MLRYKNLSLFAIYGSLLSLALIGVVLKSEIYMVAIVGLFTSGLIAMYGKMYPTARQTISESAKSVMLNVIIVVLVGSILSSIAAYILFRSLGFSGVMLGTAAACAHFLVKRDRW